MKYLVLVLVNDIFSKMVRSEIIDRVVVEMNGRLSNSPILKWKKNTRIELFAAAF